MYWKFVCKNDTEAECFKRALFGDTASFRDLVKDVKRGDTLFLYNIESDVLFGPFTAASDGMPDLEPTAWRGRFPAQVRVDFQTLGVIRGASKRFDFLKHKTIKLEDRQAEKILKVLTPIVKEVPPALKSEIQRLDGEIHQLAHRLEEALMPGRHPADRVVELEMLKGELMAKMRDFVWAVRRLDKATGILDLPSSR